MLGHDSNSVHHSCTHTYTHVWTACVQRNQRHMRKNKAQHPTDDGRDYPPTKKKVLGIFCFLVMCTQLLLTHRVSATVSMRGYYTHTKVPKNYCNTAHDDIVFFFGVADRIVFMSGRDGAVRRTITSIERG